MYKHLYTKKVLLWVGGVAEVIEYLPSQHKTLSSKFWYHHKRRRGKGREREGKEGERGNEKGKEEKRKKEGMNKLNK
jgi:hypothetical protein